MSIAKPELRLEFAMTYRLEVRGPAESRDAWLTQSLFVARGRLLAAKTREYAVFGCCDRERAQRPNPKNSSRADFFGNSM